MNSQEGMSTIGSTNSYWEVDQVPHLSNETSGGRFRLTYITQEIGRIIEPVIRSLSETENVDVAKEVQELIPMFIEIFLELKESYFDLSNLRPLTAANLEDGSFLIEWIHLNYRIGIVIDNDPKDSMWYRISKSESADSNISGKLVVDDKKALLTRLISYVAMNS